MKSISVGELVNIVGGKLLTGNTGISVTDVAIDSRVVEEGMLFVPIIGEKVDAHKFIPEVAKKATAVFTDRESVLDEVDDQYKESCAIIKVDDTLRAFQVMGIYFRKHYDKKVVGVTGSVGKTTTREMITAALGSSFAVYSTKKNYNSEIGTPITLAGMLDEPSDVAVLELGISDFGEMDVLTEMTMPNIGVVTNIGVSHIEYFKTRDNICIEKLKIAGRMDDTGVLFLNGEDKFLLAMRNNLSVKAFYYGLHENQDYHAEDIRIEDGRSCFTYVHGDTRVEMSLNLLGNHMILNAVAAMAVCEYMGLDLDKAADALSKFKGQRQNVYKSEDGFTIIDDAYNASPDSMRAELAVLAETPTTGRRIAVLGDMLELGPDSPKFHAEVGRAVLSNDVDILITVGNEMKNAHELVKSSDADDIEAVHFDENAGVADYIKNIAKEGDTILFKASNGMKFKEIITEFKPAI